MVHHCNLENIIILSINTIVLIVIGFAIANPSKDNKGIDELKPITIIFKFIVYIRYILNYKNSY